MIKMSLPNIAIPQNLSVLKTSEKWQSVKTTQKSSSVSFKLYSIQEIERCQLSSTEACLKYGIQATATIRAWFRK